MSNAELKSIQEVIVSTLSRSGASGWSKKDKEALAEDILKDIQLAGYHIYEYNPRKP
jgi:hypothetical protein